MGADIDVPLRYMSFMLVVEYLLVSSSGYFFVRPLPIAWAAMICYPARRDPVANDLCLLSMPESSTAIVTPEPSRVLFKPSSDF